MSWKGQKGQALTPWEEEKKRQAKRERRRQEGRRKAEWRCIECKDTNFFQLRNGQENTTCRGCGAPRDDQCRWIDRWGVEHSPERPRRTRSESAWGSKWAGSGGSGGPRGSPKGQGKRPPSQGRGGGGASSADAPPAAKLAEARRQYKAAIAAGLDQALIDQLKVSLKDAERAEEAARPLGQRLDAARAQLTKATTALQKKQDLIAAMQDELRAPL